MSAIQPATYITDLQHFYHEHFCHIAATHPSPIPTISTYSLDNDRFTTFLMSFTPVNVFPRSTTDALSDFSKISIRVTFGRAVVQKPFIFETHIAHTLHSLAGVLCF